MELQRSLSDWNETIENEPKRHTPSLTSEIGDSVSESATHKDFPWLNPDGSRKSDSEIQLLSRSWKPDTWEIYLSTLETPQREALFGDPHDIEEVNAQEYATMLFSFLEHDEFPHLRAAIEVGLRKLSSNQYQVIKLLFWENKTQEDIASELKISRASVRTHIHRGLKKIKQLLQGQFIEKRAKAAQKIVTQLQECRRQK